MIDDIKKLIGGIVKSKNELLFCNDQNIFSKNIILFDLEHNGWLGKNMGIKPNC